MKFVCTEYLIKVKQNQQPVFHLAHAADIFSADLIGNDSRGRLNTAFREAYDLAHRINDETHHGLAYISNNDAGILILLLLSIPIITLRLITTIILPRRLIIPFT